MTKTAHILHATFHLASSAFNAVVLLSGVLPDPYKTPVVAFVAAVQSVVAFLHVAHMLKSS